jgi:cytochrome P450
MIISGQLIVIQTVATVISFFLAMIRYPDVQRKAQEEIDRVVGQDRLPDFGDLESLPYINAVLLETLRWLPATPQGG